MVRKSKIVHFSGLEKTNTALGCSQWILNPGGKGLSISKNGRGHWGSSPCQNDVENNTFQFQTISTKPFPIRSVSGPLDICPFSPVVFNWHSFLDVRVKNLFCPFPDWKFWVDFNVCEGFVNIAWRWHQFWGRRYIEMSPKVCKCFPNYTQFWIVLLCIQN